MKKEFARLLNSSKLALLYMLASFLFISCASCAKAQEGQGSGEGWGGGRKTSQGKKPQGQDAESAEPVEIRLARLFDICKSDKLEDAASYFVYRGEDKTREWKDTLHADNPADKAAITGICWRIKSYLDESSNYSFDGVKVEKESEGEWHALDVSFCQGDKSKKVIFAFLLIKGQFAIGDID
jgi:hypothetical protein